MKILHAIPYMHPDTGGPPVVADRFCQELISKGVEASVLTTDALVPLGDTDWELPFQQRYEMTVLPSWGRKTFGYSRKLFPFLKTRIREYDLVHIHNLWSYMNVLVSKVCRTHNVPYVVSTHGMLDPNSLARKSLKKKWYGKLIEFPQLRQASSMIYTHPEEEHLANQSCPGLPAGHIIPLGADELPQTDFSGNVLGLKKKFPHWEQKKLVLFFGRIHPKKGLDLLIPGFKQLLKTKTVPEAHLVLAGPIDSAYKNRIEELIKEHQLEKECTFTGPVYGVDKWALLSLADLFVLPSYQENFAITVAEALRVGLPVILSSHVNIWEDVVSAKAGLKCELDPKHIAEKLAKVLLDQRLHQELSSQGPALVERSFTWKVAGDKLLACYESLLNKFV